MPIGILFDKSTGIIWVAEGIGNIDPIKNYKINEYPIPAKINDYPLPTELFMSPVSADNLYISDHDNKTVSVFNLVTFKTYPVFNPIALPFGMAMDNYGFLWVAEHTTNKIAVIDPYIQFLTSDSGGIIWFAEQPPIQLHERECNSICLTWI